MSCKRIFPPSACSFFYFVCPFRFLVPHEDLTAIVALWWYSPPLSLVLSQTLDRKSIPTEKSANHLKSAKFNPSFLGFPKNPSLLSLQDFIPPHLASSSLRYLVLSLFPPPLGKYRCLSEANRASFLAFHRIKPCYPFFFRPFPLKSCFPFSLFSCSSPA